MRPRSGSCQRSSASTRRTAPRRDVDDRLEVQLAARCSCSARRSAVSTCRRCVRRCGELGGEGAEAVSPELLRVVHRRVGVLEQRLGVACRPRDGVRGRGCRSRGSRGPRPGRGGAPRRGSCARRARARPRRAGPRGRPRTRRPRCARARRFGAAPPRMRRASSFSSASPTRWPSVSFTSLKWSRSRNITPTRRLRARARARARPRGGRAAARCWAVP